MTAYVPPQPAPQAAQTQSLPTQSLPGQPLQGQPARAEMPDYWSQLAWLSAGASPLAAWRRAARLSPADLAAASGLDVETIAAIEARGHAPSLAEREALARALGLCAGDLED